MSTEHEHLRAERFDFDLPRNTAVFICHRVRDGAPVLHASHDEEGDWQFLCGGDHGDDSPDGGLLTCLECVVARDLSLNELADLCSNWSARREATGAPWQRHDHFEDAINEAMERHGWFVALIRAERDQPAFAYSIGLFKNYGHAELIILGLRPEAMQGILNACGDLIKAGQKLPLGARVKDVVEGYDVEFRQVMSRESYKEHVGYGLWFNRGPTFPLFQLVWPDKKGLFPWEDGSDPVMAQQQPLLP